MKRLKFLIISFYFPPCNGTPAPRPFSWARVFSQQGHDVTVVTRFWKHDDNLWSDYIKGTEETEPKLEKVNGFKVWRLPFKAYSYPKNPIVNKVSTVSSLILGNLEREVDCMQFYPFLEKLLKTEKFDLIVTSAPPWNIVKLASKLFSKFNIPFIPDFRDFENDIVLNQNPQASKGRMFEFYLNRFNMLNWCKKSLLIVSASRVLGDYITNRIKVPNIEVLNGYDSFVLKKLKDNGPNDKLTISVIGYLYKWQNLDILFDGFEQFLEKHDKPKVIIRFIGQNGVPEVAQKIKDRLDANYIEMMDRQSIEVANQLGKDSDILYYAAWSGWKGVYSAKIATYLGLQKNILIAPGDDDVIDDIINETNSGFVINDTNALALQLDNWYIEWLEKGHLDYDGKTERIEGYSRENQALNFLQHIEKTLT